MKVANGESVPKWIPSEEGVFYPDTAKEILPTRPQALVSTSEFNDVQARLRSMITNRRKGRDDNAPTLQKRDDSETASNKSKTQKDPTGDQTTDDKPPVLKRRD